jgi:hypothetical protein
MSDSCWRCGNISFWFDRTMEEPCGSMHYVCDKCGSQQSCGADDCLYGKKWEPANDEAKDARIAALEAEVERLSNYINDACAILRSPDLTNDGGPGLLGDIKALRHNYLAAVDEANGLALLIDKIRQERDELRARLAGVRGWREKHPWANEVFYMDELDDILNEKEGE